jgi:hypothetical protein
MISTFVQLPNLSRIMQQLRTIKASRYLSRPRRRLAALSFTPIWVEDNALLSYRQFSVLFRESFNVLLHRIMDNSISTIILRLLSALPNTSFKSLYTTLAAVQQGHGLELQFSLELQKDQFIYTSIGSLKQFWISKKSFCTGQNLVPRSMKKSLNGII